jgi:NAD(P)H-nitrite reductase large subunit
MLSCGRIEAQDGEDELIIHEDEGSKTYLKLLIRDGRLQGAILLGHAPAASAISSAVKDNQDVSAILGRLRAGDLDALTTTCESMSVSGTKQTCSKRRRMSASGGQNGR